MKFTATFLTFTALLALAADDVTVIARNRLDSLDDVDSTSDMRIDHVLTTDDNGSLRIRAKQPQRILLVETGAIDVQGVNLVFQADIRAAGVKGDVYLELECRFPGTGSHVSRALDYALSGSTGFVSAETSYRLGKSDRPESVKLYLVINGKGTVWADNVRLGTRPVE